MACLRGSVITLVAFVWLYSTVSFHMDPQRTQSTQNHIGCICSIFLLCVFSNVSSNCLHKRMHNHIGCICLAFPRCAFSNVSSNVLYKRMHNYIGCICLASPQFLYHCRIFSSYYSLQNFPPSIAGNKKISGSECRVLLSLLLSSGHWYKMTISSASASASASVFWWK